jgi:hypothetical protein
MSAGAIAGLTGYSRNPSDGALAQAGGGGGGAQRNGGSGGAGGGGGAGLAIIIELF